MSKHAKYRPKHRSTPRPRLAPRMVRGAVVMGGLAVATTGMSVSGGVMNADSIDGAGDLVDAMSAAAGTAIGGGRATLAGASVQQRDQQVSRSDRRETGAALAARRAVLGTDQGPAIAATETVSEGDPRAIGRVLLAEFGFPADEFSCLDSLYVSESNWRVDADNPTSSAYGIPQALTSMHDLPAEYTTSAEAQIRWGLEYIQRAYGTPCNAWSFKQGHGWY